MSLHTPIQWSDSTVNPVGGCGGCELWIATVPAENKNKKGKRKKRRVCYAGHSTQWRKGKNRAFAQDFDMPELFPGRMAEAASWPDLLGKPHGGPFPKPWLDGAQRLIFVSDMGDALSEGRYRDAGNYLTAKDKRKAKRGFVHEGGVPFEYLKSEIIDNVLSEKGRRHIWLWLTKRPARMAEFSAWLLEKHGIPWPENLWVGTSITTRATLGRVRQLAKVGAAVMFLSVEPLWEAVSFKKIFSDFPTVRWLLLGGESDQGEARAHEFKLEWAREILKECREAGVKYFLKQLGSNVTEAGVALDFGKGHAGEWGKWPQDLRVREVPEEAFVTPATVTQSVSV